LQEIITVKGPRLTSRKQGSALREQIHQAITKTGQAIINTRTLEQLHPKAADACFGVLARDHGSAWVSNHVLLPDIRWEFLVIIAEAMQTRAREGG